MYLFNLSQYIMLLDCCSCSTRSLKIFLVLCHYFRVCFNVEPMCLSHLSKKVSSNCIQCIVIIFLMRLTLCLIVCKQEHLKQCLKLLSKRTGSRRWSAREFHTNGAVTLKVCRPVQDSLAPSVHFGRQFTIYGNLQKKYKSNYFIVRPKVDHRAGLLSLPHLGIFAIHTR